MSKHTSNTSTIAAADVALMSDGGRRSTSVDTPTFAAVKPKRIETHRKKNGANTHPTVLTQGLEDLTEITDPRIGLPLEVAVIVWTLLSHVIGDATGWRTFTANVCQTLAGIGHLRIVDKDPFTGTEVELSAPMPSVPVRGWPKADSALRRLGWTPRKLDEEWNKAVALSGGFARLPLPLVVHLFPPEIWRMVALILTWTPAQMNRYLDAYLRMLVAGNAPGGFKRTPRSANNVQDAVRRLLSRIVESRENGYYAQELSAWTHVPKRVEIPAATGVAIKRDRPVNKAPEPRNVRRYLAELDAEIARKRRTASGRRRLLTLLRDRALLESVIVTASRCEPFAVMIVGDVHAEYRCPWDGVKRPAIRLRELKGNRTDIHWVVITEEHYRHIVEYMEYAGIVGEPDHQMWHAEWAYFDKTTGDQLPATVGSPLFETIAGRARVARLLPNGEITPASMGTILATLATRCGEPGVTHTAHSLRHLGSQACKDGAKAYLTEHPETPGSVSVEVIAKALMGHEFKRVSDLYDELNEPGAKQELAAIGADCVWGLLRGAAGAAKGLDEPRLLEALERLQEAAAELSASRKRAAAAEGVLRAIEAGETAKQREIRTLRAQKTAVRSKMLDLHESGRATDADHRRAELERDHLDDEIERRQDDLVRFERRLNRELRQEQDRQLALEKRLEALRKELEDAKTARIPLPDLAAPYNADRRLEELLGGVPSNDGGVATSELTLARDRLAPAEYARIMGIPISTLNRQIKQALASDDGFAFGGGRDNPRQPFGQPIEQVLEVQGSHSRWVVYSALDKSWYLPEQIAAMKAALAKPL